MKLFFLGLDGCSAQIMFERDLPNVQRLLQSCSFQASLAEEEFQYTGPSWTSIYTGLSAREHNVKDLWGRETEDSKSYDTIRHPMLWEMLNEAGLTTGLVHMPVTTANREVDGFVMSGFPNPLEFAGPVAELMPLFQARDVSDLIRLTPRDRILDNTWYRKYPLERTVELLKMMIEWKTEALRMLVQSQEVDCLFVQYSFLDRIGHLLNQYLRAADGQNWSYEPLLELYDWLDGHISELLDVGEDYDNLVIVSDHGWPATASEPYMHDGKLFGAWHSQDGVLIMRGPDVTPGRQLPCYNRDVCEKTLDLLGLKLDQLRPTTSVSVTERQDNDSADDADVIEERLRALGYL